MICIYAVAYIVANFIANLQEYLIFGAVLIA